jgi:succinate dehydrogenase/fumarate reductase flavoprotein subunit
MHVATDVLVVGAGGAGMYAALAAAREGAQVLLVDKNVVGRGGATIMAQMTVAAAVGEEEPDTVEEHLRDTLDAGRGLCDERLAGLLCGEAPVRIREMDAWRVGWARRADGRMAAVMAPGHRRKRCVYVDFLNTGPAVAATLRRQVSRADAIRRASSLVVTDLVVKDGEAIGAVGFDLPTGEVVTIAAKAVIIATGGLTKLYERNSASNNMGGDGYALALQAGAELLDMEFVQFFPIGHLAPRLVGMDPIMWDPFRYKLGGRLLNGNREEFVERYGGADQNGYATPRDIATYAILKEVEAGRGSPHGGAWLSFEHVPAAKLAEAFGPVIDRLAGNGIDLAKGPVEVAPIAHYHMGGIRADCTMESSVRSLFAAGEATGGANGANRLSGNAIPEALVFGEVAGRHAAARAKQRTGAWQAGAAASAAEAIRAVPGRNGAAPAPLLAELRQLMQQKVGPLRTREGLDAALARLVAMRRDELPRAAVSREMRYNTDLLEWFELRGSLLAAEAVTRAALAREESRGAHQREDFPETSSGFGRSRRVALRDDAVELVAEAA